MLGKLREKYEEFIKPLGKFLGSLGFTPNILTLLSFVVSILSSYAYYLKNPIFGCSLILLSGLLDMLDGAVARATRKETKFGSTLDHVVDRYAEFFIILGIILGGFSNWLFGFFALFGMLMASFIRAKAESVGGLESCTVGIAERQEKLIILVLGSILTIFSPQILEYSIILVGLISHITVIQRLHYTWVKTGGY